MLFVFLKFLEAIVHQNTAIRPNATTALTPVMPVKTGTSEHMRDNFTEHTPNATTKCMSAVCTA